ncbi:MAG TPA: tetratricopeptide repeat protein [Gemmatimonadaceae bacterium]|nr:tetratricopeptide repeat protein [Gemmatimonadaceae bacterium]
MRYGPVSLVLCALLAARVDGQATADTTLVSGLALFDAGHRAAAVPLLEPYAKTNAVAAFDLGRAALDEGHFGPAVDWFERAVSLDHDNPIYWDRLGQAYAGHALESDFFLKYKLAHRCKAAFEKAVALDSTNLDARTDLIEYFAQAPGIVGGDRQRAREMSVALGQWAPYYGLQSMLLTCRVSRDSTCVRVTTDSLMAAFPDSSLGYVALADWFAEAQQYDSAFALLDRRLAGHPDDWQTLYELGRVGALSGRRLDDAATALERFIASPVGANPSKRVQLSRAHSRLAQIFAQTNLPDSARAEYELAVTIDPRDGDAKKALKAFH